MNNPSSPADINKNSATETDDLAERILIARLSAGAILGAPTGETQVGEHLCRLSYQWAEHWIHWRTKRQ